MDRTRLDRAARSRRATRNWFPSFGLSIQDLPIRGHVWEAPSQTHQRFGHPVLYIFGAVRFSSDLNTVFTRGSYYTSFPPLLPLAINGRPQVSANVGGTVTDTKVSWASSNQTNRCLLWHEERYPPPRCPR